MFDLFGYRYTASAWTAQKTPLFLRAYLLLQDLFTGSLPGKGCLFWLLYFAFQESFYNVCIKWLQHFPKYFVTKMHTAH
jgi:hypothetical protein